MDPATDFPLPFTQDFNDYVQNWDVTIVWDKDHTMVDQDNVLRPNLEQCLLGFQKKYPEWKHVILTENILDSVEEMFEKHPKIRSVFEIVLCYDNYFSRAAVRSFFRNRGYWWPWGRKIRNERSRRKRRRVNDIFLGKKVVLIDDLRDGRVPEHSFCVTCKVWTNESSQKDEINWPLTIEDSILILLKNLYRYDTKNII
jgi:hypothetical protein